MMIRTPHTITNEGNAYASNNTRCWWCCHQFQGPSIPLTFGYDSHRKRFKTYGTFCSFSCAKAYNIDRYGINQGGNNAQWLLLLRRQMSGGKTLIGTIPIAPSRQALSVFGGPLSIEEFRGNHNDIIECFPDCIHQVSLVNKPKYNSTDPTIVYNENDTIGAPVPESGGEVPVPVSGGGAPVPGGALKLKRAKPLKRDTTVLMGLVKKT